MRPALFVTVAYFALAASTYAQVPDSLSLQGYLEGAGTTTLPIVTKLYKGPTEVYSQTHPSVDVTNGVFNVIVGPLGSLAFDEPIDLGITVGGDSEISPRTPLTSAPYSLGLRLPFEGSSSGTGMTITTAAVNGFEVEQAGADGLAVGRANSDGVGVDSALSNGVRVGYAGSAGLKVTKAADGVRIDNATADGIDIPAVGNRGIALGLIGTPLAGFFNPSSNVGLEIVGAQTNGIWLGYAGSEGVTVRQVGSPAGVADVGGAGYGFQVWGAKFGVGVGRVDFDGVRIDSAGRDGIDVLRAGRAGVVVYQTGNPTSSPFIQTQSPNGVEVVNTAGDGVFVGNPDDNGVQVYQAGENGVYVRTADDDGIYVASADSFSLHIRGQKNGDGIADHVALIENNGTTAGPDVLALKVPNSSPGTATNFITFYSGSDAVLGAIEGGGGGTVQFTSPGGDYAEYLPRMNAADSMEGGDVVGVFGGRISFRTAGADKVMAVSDEAVVVGRMPKGEDPSLVEAVGFVGQIRVKTSGPVHSGDFIVASGNDDGTAIAVDPGALELAHLDGLLGRAWEDAPAGLHRVTTVVGLDETAVLQLIAERLQGQIEAMRKELTALDERLARIEAWGRP